MRAKPSKRGEVPSATAALTARVVASPSLHEALKDFSWQYDKGDFAHFAQLFYHFEGFFEKHVASRKSLLLTGSPAAEQEAPFPVEDCLAVLRTTGIVLENCSGKSEFKSYDHLCHLLASPHPEVVAASLHTLMCFLKRTLHASLRWHGYKEVNARLLALSQGWGGKEEGLRLATCTREDMQAQAEQFLHKATTLHYLFFRADGAAPSDPPVPEASSRTAVVVNVADLHKSPEQETQLLQRLVLQHDVPEQHRFPLLAKIRLARALGSLEGRRHLARVRLMALWVLLQTHPPHEEMHALLASDPDLVSDLTALAKAEPVPLSLRALAVRVLAALVSDRVHGQSALVAVSLPMGGGMLSMLLHRAVTDVATAAAAPPPLGGTAQADPDADAKLDFADALVALVAALLTSLQGCIALENADTVRALLPLLRDMQPSHMTLVASAVKALETLMDHSEAAAATFRDLNGLTEMTERLAKEAGVPLEAPPAAGTEGAAGTSVAGAAFVTAAVAAAAAPSSPPPPTPAAASSSSSSSSTSMHVPYARKVLMRFLLRAIAMASNTPTAGGAAAARVPEGDAAALLYRCLRALFDSADAFGSNLFVLSASVVTDLVHHDPLVYRTIDAAGLPLAFVGAVKRGVLPYGEAIVTIANTLVALCLNTGGLEMVLRERVLDSLIPIFTLKKYNKALHGEVPVMVGAGLEELFRFVPQLRPDGIEAMADIFRAICVIGGDKEEADKAMQQRSQQQARERDLRHQQRTQAAERAAVAVAAAAAGEATGVSAAAVVAGPGPMDTDPMPIGSGSVDAAGGTAAAGTTTGPAAGAAAEPAPALAAAAPIPRVPYDLSQALQDMHSADAHGFLPDAISHATRMLEVLLSNGESRRQFVARGGVDLLLKLHSLPRLSFTFAFSSSSHPLLTLLRGLAPHHAEALSLKTRDLLSEQLDLALVEVQAMGLTCVPELPEDRRKSYLKVVSSIAGLCSLASSVARNATHMLPMIATGPNPLLSRMGQLQRLLMQQAALGDAWAMAKDARERATAAANAGTGSSVAGPDAAIGGAAAAAAEAAASRTPPAAAAATTPLSMELDGEPLPTGDEVEGEEPMAMEEEEEQEEEAERRDPAAALSAPLSSPAPAAAGAAPATGATALPHKKKSAEVVAHEILHHAVGMLRSFFISVAKSIHAPARTRGESAAAAAAAAASPGVGARAAALALAALLRSTLALRLSGGCAKEPSPLTAASPPQDTHLVRVADEVSSLLFDSRRRSCHVLLLNYFVALGGLRPLLGAFRLATEQLWAAITAEQQQQQQQQQQQRGAVAAAGAAAADVAMAEAGPSAAAPSAAPAASAAAAPAGVSAAAAAAMAAAGHSGSSSRGSHKEKDPRTVAERGVAAFLALLEQLSSATMVCASPQSNALLVTQLPAGAGALLAAQHKEPVNLLRHVQSSIMASVLEVWAHPSLPVAGPAITASLVSVLSRCAEGVTPAAVAMLRGQQQQPGATTRATATATATAAATAAAAAGGGAAAARAGQGSRAGASPTPATGFQLDPRVVQSIVEMGFPQARVEDALQRIGANAVEAAMDWLVAHPEGTTAPAAAQAAAARAPPSSQDVDERLLSQALAEALSAIGVASPGSAAAAGTAVEEAPKAKEKGKGRADATPAAAAGTSTATPAAPGAAQLVDGAVSILCRMPSGVFSMSDLLLTLATKDAGKDRAVVVKALTDKLRLPNDVAPSTSSRPDPATVAPSSSSSASADPPSPPAAELFTASRLLLLLLTRDPPSRPLACTQGLPDKLLALLDAWLAQYETAMSVPPAPARDGVASTSGQNQQQQAQQLAVPVWVEVLLLTLTCLASMTPKPKPATAAPPPPAAAAAAAAPAAAQPDAAAWARRAGANPFALPDNPFLPSAAVGGSPSFTARDYMLDVMGLAPPSSLSGAFAPAPVPPAQPTTAAEREAALQGVLTAAMAAWHPTGLLSEEQAVRCASSCLRLLRQLHVHAATWGPKPAAAGDVTQPDAGAVTLAALELLARAARRRAAARLLLSGDGSAVSAGVAAASPSALTSLLTLPRTCLLPQFARAEAFIVAAVRAAAESCPATMAAWMTSELRAFFAQPNHLRGLPLPYGIPPRRDGAPYPPMAPVTTFLSSLARVMARDPTLFIEVVGQTCTMEPPPPGHLGSQQYVRLRTAEDGPAATTAAATATAATATAGAEAGATTPAPTSAGEPPATAAPVAAASVAGSGPAGGARPLEQGPAASSPAGQERGLRDSAATKTAADASVDAMSASPAFTEVLDCLLGVVMSWGREPLSGGQGPKQQQQAGGIEDMELDASGVQQRDQRTKGVPSQMEGLAVDAAATGAAGSGAVDALAEQQAKVTEPALSQVAALRVLSELCLVHNAVVPLLLQRDAEMWAREHAYLQQHGVAAAGGAAAALLAPLAAWGPASPAAADAAAGPRQGEDGGVARAGSLLKQLLHRQLLAPDAAPLAPSVANRASHLIQAMCISSAEARNRVANEVVATLMLGVPAIQEQQDPAGDIPTAKLQFSPEEMALALAPVEGAKPDAAGAFTAHPGCPHPVKVRMFVALLATLLQPVPLDPRAVPDTRHGGDVNREVWPSLPPAATVSSDTLRTLRELGAAKALASALHLLQPAHPGFSAAVSAILKPLEALTRDMAQWAAPPKPPRSAWTPGAGWRDPVRPTGRPESARRTGVPAGLEERLMMPRGRSLVGAGGGNGGTAEALMRWDLDGGSGEPQTAAQARRPGFAPLPAVPAVQTHTVEGGPTFAGPPSPVMGTVDGVDEPLAATAAAGDVPLLGGSQEEEPLGFAEAHGEMMEGVERAHREMMEGVERGGGRYGDGDGEGPGGEEGEMPELLNDGEEGEDEDDGPPGLVGSESDQLDMHGPEEDAEDAGLSGSEEGHDPMAMGGDDEGDNEEEHGEGRQGDDLSAGSDGEASGGGVDPDRGMSDSDGPPDDGDGDEAAMGVRGNDAHGNGENGYYGVHRRGHRRAGRLPDLLDGFEGAADNRLRFADGADGALAAIGEAAETFVTRAMEVHEAAVGAPMRAHHVQEEVEEDEDEEGDEGDEADEAAEEMEGAVEAAAAEVDDVAVPEFGLEQELRELAALPGAGGRQGGRPPLVAMADDEDAGLEFILRVTEGPAMGNVGRGGGMGAMMPALLQMLGDTLSGQMHGTRRTRTGRAPRMTMTGGPDPLSDGAAAADQLAASHFLPQQHRMLERPHATGVAPGALGASVGLQVHVAPGGLVSLVPMQRTHTHGGGADLGVAGGLAEQLMLAHDPTGIVVAPAVARDRHGRRLRTATLNALAHDGHQRALERLLNRGVGVANQAGTPAPADTFPSVFAPVAAGGLGAGTLVSRFSGFGGAAVGPTPGGVSDLFGGSGGAGSRSVAAARRLLHQLMESEGSHRRPSGFESAAAVGGGGEELMFDTRHLEAPLVSLLLAQNPQAAAQAHAATVPTPFPRPLVADAAAAARPARVPAVNAAQQAGVASSATALTPAALASQVAGLLAELDQPRSARRVAARAAEIAALASRMAAEARAGARRSTRAASRAVRFEAPPPPPGSAAATGAGPPPPRVAQQQQLAEGLASALQAALQASSASAAPPAASGAGGGTEAGAATAAASAGPSQAFRRRSAETATQELGRRQVRRRTHASSPRGQEVADANVQPSSADVLRAQLAAGLQQLEAAGQQLGGGQRRPETQHRQQLEAGRQSLEAGRQLVAGEQRRREAGHRLVRRGAGQPSAEAPMVAAERQPTTAAERAAAAPSPPPAGGSPDWVLPEGLDPEFLAALPRDIQEELMEQQRAAGRRRQRRSDTAAAAAPPPPPPLPAGAGPATAAAAAPGSAGTAEPGSAAAATPSSAAAAGGASARTMPPGLDSLQALHLADVPHSVPSRSPAPLQQQRSAHTYSDATLPRQMARRSTPMPPPRAAVLGAAAAASASLSRATAGPGPLVGAAAEDAAAARESPCLLGDADLCTLVALLQAERGPAKEAYERVLSNLCGQTRSRRSLLRMLMAMVHSSAREEPEAVAAAALVGSAAAGPSAAPAVTVGHGPLSHGLAAAQLPLRPGPSQLACRAPHALHRALDMCLHLARHSNGVATTLLLLRVPPSLADAMATAATVASPPVVAAADAKGKGPASAAAALAPAARDEPQLRSALEVLLSTLPMPTCQRNQEATALVVQLAEVLLRCVAAQIDALTTEAEKREAVASAAAVAATAGANTDLQAMPAWVQTPFGRPAAPALAPGVAATASASAGAGPSTLAPASVAAATTASARYATVAAELTSVVASLPPSLVRHLASLVGQPALSDATFASAGNALKHLLDAASDPHLLLVLGVLLGCLMRLSAAAQVLLCPQMSALDGCGSGTPTPLTEDVAGLAAMASLGNMMLRLLRLLQGLKQEAPRGAPTPADADTGDAQQRARALVEHVSVARRSRGSARDRAADEVAAGTAETVALAAPTPRQRQRESVNEAVASLLATASPSLSRMWSDLSAFVSGIEDGMAASGSGGAAGAATAAAAAAGAEAAGSRAAEALPPGAAQALPLVQAFFVACALEGGLPPEPAPPPPLPPGGLLSQPSAVLLGAFPSGMLDPGASPAGLPVGISQASASSPASAAPASASASASEHQGAAESASQGLGRAASLQRAPSQAPDEACAPFLRFAERHRRLLNAYIRQSRSLLEGSLAPLMRVHKLIDFDNRRTWFRRNVGWRGSHGRSLRINVRREHVFEDSFNQLRSRTPEEMRFRLSVEFTGEGAVDAGGVTREWYQVVAREMFNPNLALFVAVPEGSTTFQPNPSSVIQSDRGINHLEYFKFVGRIVGKALVDGQLMDAYFTRSFYKHMLGLPLTHADIEAVDPEYYKNLRWMLENDITDVLDLTFTAESDFFGRKEVVELVPGGKDVRVSELNKREYVSLTTRHRLTTSIKAQIAAFLEGFWQLVPRQHIAIFSDHELELMISGLPEVDIADLRAHTDYTGYSTTSPVVRWFWDVVLAMSAEDKALLLQFVTGTSKVPLEGFKALHGMGGPQRFHIHKAYGKSDRLPSAHTCFNQLDLPQYESKQQLQEKLMVALRQGAEGFAFA